MTCPATRRSFVIAAFLLLSIAAFAQPGTPDKSENKPYRIHTFGRQVTIKSTKQIQHIMVWTASGHRIVEQRDFNASNYTFTARMKESVFFIMIQYQGSKPYTEKIGVK